MKRGEVVTVAIGGDYGKPRPAVIVQSNSLPDHLPSVVICQMTSDLDNQADFRIVVYPTTDNGLRVQSQIMVDRPVAVRRERIGRSIGHLSDRDMARVNAALTLVLGLAD